MMHWWSPFIWIAPSAPLWFGYILPQMWKRHKRNTKKGKRTEWIATAEANNFYREAEQEDWCAGCDELRPRSWMAFVDEDDDGVPDAVYRCRVCRGLGEPVTPESSQEACDERMEGVFWDASVGRLVDVEVHEDSCQCTNCESNRVYVGKWAAQDFADNRGDNVIEYHDLTPEQVSNLINTMRANGIVGTVINDRGKYSAKIRTDCLDLSQLLADYTDAVETYRAAGVDATNETDAAYRERLARRAELRKKYRMDEPPKAPHQGHWEWTGMGREWVDAE